MKGIHWLPIDYLLKASVMGSFCVFFAAKLKKLLNSLVASDLTQHGTRVAYNEIIWIIWSMYLKYTRFPENLFWCTLKIKSFELRLFSLTDDISLFGDIHLLTFNGSAVMITLIYIHFYPLSGATTWPTIHHRELPSYAARAKSGGLLADDVESEVNDTAGHDRNGRGKWIITLMS